jgi:hypothetical protein
VRASRVTAKARRSRRWTRRRCTWSRWRSPAPGSRDAQPLPSAHVRAGLADAKWSLRRDIIRALVKRTNVTDVHITVVFRVGRTPLAPLLPTTLGHIGGHVYLSSTRKQGVALLGAVRLVYLGLSRVGATCHNDLRQPVRRLAQKSRCVWETAWAQHCCTDNRPPPRSAPARYLRADRETQ